MELFDYSLWGAPLALFIAVRVVGGTVGRVAVGSEIAALRAGCLWWGEFPSQAISISVSHCVGEKHRLSQRGVTLASEMDAAVWTAIGLLAATSLGTIFYLGSRMDALAARLDARMDAGFARVDAGFARVDARFDAIEARFDGVASRLDAHMDRHAS